MSCHITATSLDVSSNALTELHTGFFGSANLFFLAADNNPELRMDVGSSDAGDCLSPSTLLMADPAYFQNMVGRDGIQCTTVCTQTGMITQIDASANVSAMCRCYLAIG